MKNLDFTAEQILSITSPEKLFTDPSKVKEEYRQLCRHWHPDKNSKASPEVSAKINHLHSIAEEKIATGSWEVLGSLTLELIDKTIKFKYNRKRTLDVGDCYIGDSHITYIIPKENADLVTNHSKMVPTSFANPKMKDEISKLLPKTKFISKTKDGKSQVVVIEKTEDIFSLQDILEHFHHKIPPSHMAWMMSRVLNLICFLKYAGIVHGDISPDSVFVSPKQHCVYFYGGFWYATKDGEKLKALPSRSISLIPKKIIEDKIAKSEIDTNLAKLLGLEMLGDVFGMKLMTDKTIPKPLFNWLRFPGSVDSFSDLKTWKEKILIDSFGKRKYVELNIKREDIYLL
jgi:serine/threonine protein kinase